ncbi:MAG: carbon storage regulator [Planctomycetaceae bacterium]|nr:carbon storage regulator [Planctomycetaceae bacterium]
MLVLTRRTGEEIVIDGNIVVKVLDVKGKKVRLGLTAPAGVAVLRHEICERSATFGDAYEPSGRVLELALCGQ